MNANLIHKALASPFRRDVLAWLRTPNEVFVQGHFDFRQGVPAHLIGERSGLSQSTVSAHLARLVEAQLVVSTRMGQWTFLTRNEDVIRAFAEQICLRL